MSSPAIGMANAISAYNRTADAALGQGGVTAPQDGPVTQGGFADLVQGAIKEAVRIGEKSETLSISAMQDKTDLNQVVSAVAEAELTLQTVVAVRDKVVEAYRQILRMPI